MPVGIQALQAIALWEVEVTERLVCDPISLQNDQIAKRPRLCVLQQGAKADVEG